MESFLAFFKEIFVDKVGDFLVQVLIKVLKHRSLLALIAIYSALFLGQYWVFGVLLLIWVVQDIIKKQTYMLELVYRKEDPLLYWAIVITWFVLGILSFERVQQLVYYGS